MLYRILIADEDISTRNRFARTLQQLQVPFGIVRQMSRLSPSALERDYANHAACDLLIMSVRPNRQRWEAIRRLAQVSPQLRVLLLHDATSRPPVPCDIQPLVIGEAPLHLAEAELLQWVDQALAQTQPTATLEDAVMPAPESMAAGMHHALAELQTQTGASTVLYLDYFGDIISQRGNIEAIALEPLAVSVAVTFVSSYEMAKLLGEQELNHISIHEGINYQICATNVGEGRVLALIFDTSVMAAKPKQGFVSLLLRRAAGQMRALHPVAEQWFVAQHVELAHELGGNDSMRGFWAQASSALQVAA